ncbi:hypothetical protein Zmor_025748 [Zophobas morio]|uniref:Uncharacterized protein n=1 Tax=Zophobas morio TaxID=2755281 RepID=A0AA38HTW4_9CUCU|nr:hypothetical protein Zmor_025748 [Zophobas morio]
MTSYKWVALLSGGGVLGRQLPFRRGSTWVALKPEMRIFRRSPEGLNKKLINFKHKLRKKTDHDRSGVPSDGFPSPVGAATPERDTDSERKFQFGTYVPRDCGRFGTCTFGLHNLSQNLLIFQALSPSTCAKSHFLNKGGFPGRVGAVVANSLPGFGTHFPVSGLRKFASYSSFFDLDFSMEHSLIRVSKT